MPFQSEKRNNNNNNNNNNLVIKYMYVIKKFDYKTNVICKPSYILIH